MTNTRLDSDWLYSKAQVCAKLNLTETEFKEKCSLMKILPQRFSGINYYTKTDVYNIIHRLFTDGLYRNPKVTELNKMYNDKIQSFYNELKQELSAKYENVDNYDFDQIYQKAYDQFAADQYSAKNKQ